MKYFTISEFIKSDTAIKKKIWNGASREQEDNIAALVAAVLDPLREWYGKPITVTSGFRCVAVNKDKDIGGSVTSQHTKGEAADIVGVGGSVDENFKLGKRIVEMGTFDQIIFEDVPKSGNLKPQWIHVSWKRVSDNRGNILKKVKGTKSYVGVTRKELGL